MKITFAIFLILNSLSLLAKQEVTITDEWTTPDKCSQLSEQVKKQLKEVILKLNLDENGSVLHSYTPSYRKGSGFPFRVPGTIIPSKCKIQIIFQGLGAKLEKNTFRSRTVLNKYLKWAAKQTNKYVKKIMEEEGFLVFTWHLRKKGVFMPRKYYVVHSVKLTEHQSDS